MKDRTYKYSPHESETIDSIIVESHDHLVQLERRNLLLVSFIILFSAITNVNPSDGKFLGLTFEHLSEKHFYISLISLIVYFLIAYIIYGLPKFKSAIKTKKESLRKAMTITSAVRRWHIEWSRLRLDLKYLVWLSFHFLLPVLMAIIAICAGLIKIV